MTESPAVMGVQELIDQIRTEAVESSRQEGQRIVQDARAQANEILGQAHRQAQEARDAAEKDIQAQKDAALAAVRLAARNVVMDLKTKVAAVFERQVGRLVSSATEDKQFVRDLVLALGGKSAREVIQDQPIEILLTSPEASGAAGGAGSDRLKEIVLGASSEMLREGVTLVPDGNGHGARVRVVGSNLEIDLSEQAVTALLLKHMLPRFWGILQGVE